MENVPNFKSSFANYVNQRILINTIKGIFANMQIPHHCTKSHFKCEHVYVVYYVIYVIYLSFFSIFLAGYKSFSQGHCVIEHAL